MAPTLETGCDSFPEPGASRGSEPRDESADEPRDESADGGRLGDNGSGQPPGATAPGRAVNASAPVEASQERRRRDDPCT